MNKNISKVNANDAVYLREKLGWTYEMIGNTYGVTRERIRQILHAVGKSGRIDLTTIHGTVRYRDAVCQGCGISFTYELNGTYWNKPQKFHSHACYVKHGIVRLSPEERARRHSEIVKRWRDGHRAQYDRWYKTYIKKYRRKNREALARKARIKYWSNPEYRERVLRNARAWYNREKSKKIT